MRMNTSDKQILIVEDNDNKSSKTKNTKTVKKNNTAKNKRN